ncbi:MAG: hypothetical protein HoeaKO_16780 [Hoeflea alexandrii]
MWHKRHRLCSDHHRCLRAGNEDGYYEEKPAAEVAVLSSSRCLPATIPSGYRMGFYVQIRDVHEP